MSNAPVYEIDLKSFWRDPYPDLKAMRETTPIAYVPQLGATLLTKRDDIFVNEKKTEYFSSDQPQGLMTVLMGQNLMRKDGQEHMAERRAIFPAVSPRTVKTVWIKQFHACVAQVLERCKPLGKADMVKDIAMPIAAEALKSITGLSNMNWREMDRVSQGMIDGCANYAGAPEVEARCRNCTASVDRHIDEMIDAGAFARPDVFDIRQDSSASIAFGAGPHFCAGAWASRSLIADCAMPAIFEQLPNLRPDGEVKFGGWAFRGPLALPVAWDV